MPDLMTVVSNMARDNYFVDLARNPLAQFGTERRAYLGATLLPETLVEEEAYRETSIRYRTVIANDGTRYSPAQKKESGEVIGEMLVELGHQDIAQELTGREYDGLIKLLNRRPTMEAMTRILNWVDLVVNRALIERTEVQRWQAIVNASVVRVGDNGYAETVAYPNPAGHRAAAGGTWSDDAYDPYDDIVAAAQLLWDKGYQVNRIVTSRKVMGLLTKNAKITSRNGRVIPVAGGLQVQSPRGTVDLIQAMMEADGLPGVEMYDLTYNTQTATARFMADNVMCFFATTGRDTDFQVGEVAEVIPNTLGYTAIGRGVGQSEPGRVIRTAVFEDKPPRVQAEGWQASLPVITEPEAIVVINAIA